MKRLLFEIHRWVGIALALFMALWFVSGLLIVYSSPTSLSRPQQWALADHLAPERGWLSLADAWDLSAAERRAAAPPKEGNGRERGGRVELSRSAGSSGSASESGKGPGLPVEARLQRQAGEPYWITEDGSGRRFRISARTGKLLEASADEARRIAARWVQQQTYTADGGGPRRNPPDVSYLGSVDSTALLRNQQALQPFHQFAVSEGWGRQIYVSARTGEVVHDSDWLDRALYWGGNWLHTFRPLDLAGWGQQRHDVLLWVSGFALLAALTGLIIGWLRWRPGWFGKSTYGQGRTQPYREFWFRWHFWSGLTGGVLALTWLFSGFLQNNPGEVFGRGNASREELARYHGKPTAGISSSTLQQLWRWQPAPLDGVAGVLNRVVELQWRRLGDEAVLLAITRDGRRLPQPVLDSAGEANVLDAADIGLAAQRLAGEGVGVAQPVLQQEYDSYYYPIHRRGTADRPLPVVKVELGDEAGTWLYIDPVDGRLLSRLDASRRAYRWLFSALHRWDFGWLYLRPLWDGWIVGWSLVGIALSITSLVIGWKRLRRTVRGKTSGKKRETVPALAAETR